MNLARIIKKFVLCIICVIQQSLNIDSPASEGYKTRIYSWVFFLFVIKIKIKYNAIERTKVALSQHPFSFYKCRSNRHQVTHA